MSDAALTDEEFDRALVAAAFVQIAEEGWQRFSVAAAAKAAGLPLDRARQRFPVRFAVLLRFVRLADAAALAGAAEEGSVKDRLFDMLMRRIDVLQAHRAGMIALLRGLACDPAGALLVARATQVSMGWMLEAAGVPARGPFGRLRRKGLLGVWLWTVRAWQRDESADLSATMAALDHGLQRAGQAAEFLRRTRRAAPPKGGQAPDDAAHEEPGEAPDETPDETPRGEPLPPDEG